MGELCLNISGVDEKVYWVFVPVLLYKMTSLTDKWYFSCGLVHSESVILNSLS